MERYLISQKGWIYKASKEDEIINHGIVTHGTL